MSLILMPCYRTYNSAAPKQSTQHDKSVILVILVCVILLL